MEIEDVIFLGAGASKAEGAPLQSDLFRDYFKGLTDRGDAVSPRNCRLERFFKYFFGIDIHQPNLNEVIFPTFEEVLGIIELAIDRNESFMNYCEYNCPNQSNNQKMYQIKDDLVFLIAIILDEKLRISNGYHKKLVKRLKEGNKLLKTMFISLNYDILIDNALYEMKNNKLIDIDYGIQNIFRADEIIRDKAVYLFKPHGSLNWLYCKTCKTVMLTPGEKIVAQIATRPEECTFCCSEMTPILIPPTFFKVMSNYYLQEIWHKTEINLKKAKNIYFCGYSFPDADIHIKYLLKRIEINRRLPLENIYIINNNDDVSADVRRSEEKRYKRFFKDNFNINYTDLSFEQFCENGIQEQE